MKKIASLFKNEWSLFGFKVVFYMIILVAMIYLYHFCHVGQTSFVYNQF